MLSAINLSVRAVPEASRYSFFIDAQDNESQAKMQESLEIVLLIDFFGFDLAA